MKNFRLLLQHMFNPLHVFCRLRDCGLAAPTAQKLTRAYVRILTLTHIYPAAK